MSRPSKGELRHARRTLLKLWRAGKVTRTVINGEELWALPPQDDAERAKLIADGVMRGAK